MHIVVADDFPTSALALFRHEGWHVDYRTGRTAEQLASDLALADALVVRSATKVTAALIAAAPHLRAIARAGTGVDNVDVEAATARGIVVMNAPGANSVSVAELTMAQLLSLARRLPAADASMKQGKWDKKSFLGEELRGKVLGLAGLGRIGQEVARRAKGFAMTVIAHDPFISANVASDADVELVSLDELCERSDYISLHLPSTPQTRHGFNAARLAKCKKGARLLNTARGDLIDEAALVEAIRSGHIGGAALDVFAQEPTTDHTLQQLPQVVASPHIAASTREGQELVGMETASALRDFLKSGAVRNSVNFPSVAPDQYQRLQVYITLGEELGCVLGQMGEARIESLAIRYFGELASGQHPLIVNAVLVGLFRAILSDTVTPINVGAVATARGIDVTEASGSRDTNYRSLLRLELATDTGVRSVEGAVDGESHRVVRLNEVPIDAPLSGTLLLITSDDQPGVIGDVGTLLGRQGINIANFALGRNEHEAVGIVNVDDASHEVGSELLRAIRLVPAVKAAWLVRL